MYYASMEMRRKLSEKLSEATMVSACGVLLRGLLGEMGGQVRTFSGEGKGQSSSLRAASALVLAAAELCSCSSSFFEL